MTTALVRYRVHESRVGDNQELVKAVFAELHSTRPDGLSYTVAQLQDGTFLHLVDAAPGALDSLTGLESFRRFQREIRGRCAEMPVSSAAVVVGRYGAWSER